MTHEQSDSPLRPWKDISHHVDNEDAGALESTLDDLSPSDTARAIARLSRAVQTRLLQLLPPEEAADVMEEVPEAQAADMIEHLPSIDAAAIIDEMASDEAADVLGELKIETSEAILEQMSSREAEDARELLSYDEDTAGGVMVKEYLAFSQELAVEDVLSDLRGNRIEYADYDVQYSYVVDAQGRLTGVLRLRDVVLAPPDRSLLQAMMSEPESVPVTADLTELHDFFERNSYVGVPVVDEDEMLVGVVLRSDAHRAESRQAEETYLESTGIVGGEELRSMGFLRRSSRRLSWLSINIVLNLLAASVIALYQDTLSAVIVLAVFLPIISDMSGCSGNQAVAVSIRELTLGTTVPRDIFRVLWKEWIIGLGNGLVLGALIGAAAYLWQGNLYLSAVVGGALALNTLIAVLLGGIVPLVLRSLKMDPALASGPILTTVTDVCGFFLILNFAAAAIAHLQ